MVSSAVGVIRLFGVATLMASALLAASALADSTASAEASAPLSEANLALVTTAVRYYAPKDAFDAPPYVSEYDGRDFRLQLRVVEENKAFASRDKVAAIWKYDPLTQRLTASTMNEKWNTFTFLHGVSSEYIGLSGVYVRSSISKTGSFTGSNAFGASTRVMAYGGDTLAIGVFRRLGDPASSSEFGLTATNKIEPEHARRLTPNLVLVVEGIVTKLSNGRTVMCGTSYAEPTIDSPEEIRLSECLVATKIRRLSFQDRKTGETLGEWRAP